MESWAKVLFSFYTPIGPRQSLDMLIPPFLGLISAYVSLFSLYLLHVDVWVSEVSLQSLSISFILISCGWVELMGVAMVTS